MKTKGILILIFSVLIVWPGLAQAGGELTPPDVKALVDQRVEDVFGGAGDSPDQFNLEVPEVSEDPEPPAETSEAAAAGVPDPAASSGQPSSYQTRPPAPSSPIPPFSTASSGQSKPEWVAYYQQGEIGMIAPGRDSYFGVGSSPDNQAGADTEARVEFARNVETRVEGRYLEAASVAGSRENYSLELSTKVLTDMSLKGVRITRIWRDEETGYYYSLIMMSREEYTALLERNIQEELALQKTRLAKERADLEAETERQRLAALEIQNQQEHEALRLAEEQRRLDLKEQKAATWRSKYRRFLETTPQAQLIGFRNGQLSPHFQRYRLVSGISPGISPFSGKDLFQQFSLGYTFFQFIELSADSHFLGDGTAFDWTAQEIGLKIRVLNGAGDIIRVYLGGGGKMIFLNPLTRLKGNPEDEQLSTFFGSAVVSLPMLLSSHLSLYAGADRIAGGIIMHPLFFFLGDAFGLIGEINYIIPEALRHPDYSDGWLFQGGFIFKAGRTRTTLAWRDHGNLALGLELNF